MKLQTHKPIEVSKYLQQIGFLLLTLLTTKIVQSHNFWSSGTWLKYTSIIEGIIIIGNQEKSSSL